MPRCLSDDWVTEFNRAVAGTTVAPPADGESISASSGTFSVAQLVRDVPGADGAPPSDVGTLLAVDGGVLVLSLFDAAAEPPGPPSVTISLSYTDAAALSRGELEAAELLGTGRVRVRGDLSVLVAGQSALAQAARQLDGLHATTTY
jgi:hypothetical protein